MELDSAFENTVMWCCIWSWTWLLKTLQCDTELDLTVENTTMWYHIYTELDLTVENTTMRYCTWSWTWPLKTLQCDTVYRVGLDCWKHCCVIPYTELDLTEENTALYTDGLTTSFIWFRSIGYASTDILCPINIKEAMAATRAGPLGLNNCFPSGTK